MKKIRLHLITRLLIVLISVLVQVGLIAGLIYLLGSYVLYFLALLFLLSITSVLYIITSDGYPEQKIAWILVIVSAPIFGGLLYYHFSGHVMPARRRKLYSEIDVQRKQGELYGTHNTHLTLRESPHFEKQSTYLRNIARAPAYMNTEVHYFTLGEEMHEAMLRELQLAEHFIFMEFFIIEEGLMWNAIEEILIQKARDGLDVRVLFDDVGCLLTLPADFQTRLQSHGIQCEAFNRFLHLFDGGFNHRDHRKICVIDGNTGFTGGVNLADEYINEKVKFGHWKDMAVMLRGEAVYSLCTMFLSVWSSVTEEIEDFSHFAPTLAAETDGVVQPFGDTPLDDEAVGENLYMSMIQTASRYVYITTPYLIISREMRVSLMTAAKSGVDVRLMLPGIPDKKMIFFLSRSYYEELIGAGVQIFEYTPGFMHGKVLVADDKAAVVGTINLDYRSLCLHYECGVWLYGTRAILDIREDFLKTQESCRQIYLNNFLHKGRLRGLRYLLLAVLRALSPLL